MVIFHYFTIGLLSTGFGLFMFRWLQKFRSKKCKCTVNKRKTIVITGATSGLGKHCAYELAKRNCQLILGCRNLILGKKIVDEINKSGNIARLIHLDLLDPESIKKFCNEVSEEKIDCLINNAGVMMGHFRMAQATQTEETMATNYLGTFYLTCLLLRQLSQNLDSSRIIFISSSLCKRGELDLNCLDLSSRPYNPMQAYSNSKLALCLFARELHRRTSGTSNQNQINIITMFTGGMVNTRLSRHILSNYSVLLQPVLQFLLWIFLKDPADVCHSIVHCAISQDLKQSSDELFTGFKPVPWPQRVNEYMDICPDLWNKSCSIVGISTTSLDKCS